MSCRTPLTWRVRAYEGRRERNKMNQQIWGNYWRLTVLYFNYPIFAFVHHRLLNNSPIFISFSDDSMKSVNGTSRNSSNAREFCIAFFSRILAFLWQMRTMAWSAKQWKGNFDCKAEKILCSFTKSAVTTERQRFSSLRCHFCCTSAETEK